MKLEKSDKESQKTASLLLAEALRDKEASIVLLALRAIENMELSSKKLETSLKEGRKKHRKQTYN